MNAELHRRALAALSLLLALTTAGSIYLALENRWTSAVGLAGFVVLAIIFVMHPGRLPELFTLLFVAAGAINAAGYVFDLWRAPAWFDGAAHFFTSFTAMSAIGWLLFSRTRVNAVGHWLRFALAVTGIGAALGLLWELFEWVIGIIGSPMDTLLDVIMDTFSAMAAGLFCALAAGKERQKSPGRRLAPPSRPGEVPIEPRLTWHN